MRHLSVWLLILFLLSFALSLSPGQGVISARSVPTVPRPGDLVMATFTVTNPYPYPTRVNYRLSAGGETVLFSCSWLGAGESARLQYVHPNRLQRGDQVVLVLEVWAEGKEWVKQVSLPPYHPQVWSSFVSFATFSSAVLASMVSPSYYQASLGGVGMRWLGLLLSLTLGGVLVYSELTGIPGIGHTFWGRLGPRLTRLSRVLLLVFLALVYTRVALALIA